MTERSERQLRAQLAAHASWANEADPTARTKPAREASFARFEREVDPEGTLSPTERRKRAEHLRKAHMLRMSLASTKARRERKQAATRMVVRSNRVGALRDRYLLEVGLLMMKIGHAE
jgi:hypothetical protein